MANKSKFPRKNSRTNPRSIPHTLKDMTEEYGIKFDADPSITIANYLKSTGRSSLSGLITKLDKKFE